MRGRLPSHRTMEPQPASRPDTSVVRQPYYAVIYDEAEQRLAKILIRRLSSVVSYDGLDMRQGSMGGLLAIRPHSGRRIEVDLSGDMVEQYSYLPPELRPEDPERKITIQE